MPRVTRSQPEVNYKVYFKNEPQGRYSSPSQQKTKKQKRPSRPSLPNLEPDPHELWKIWRLMKKDVESHHLYTDEEDGEHVYIKAGLPYVLFP